MQIKLACALAAIALTLACHAASWKIALADDPALEKAIDEYRYTTAVLHCYDVVFDRVETQELKAVVEPTKNVAHYESFGPGEWPKPQTYLDHQIMMRYNDQLIDRERLISETFEPKTKQRSFLQISKGESVVSYQGKVVVIGTNSQANFAQERFHYSQLYLNANGDTTFASLFETRSIVKHVEDPATPHHFVIEIPHEENSERLEWGFRVWLDPHKGYLPTRIDRLSADMQTLRERVDITDFKATGNGFAAPIRASIRRFDTTRGGKFFGKLTDETQISVDTEKSTWNEPVDCSEFDKIDLPAETRVMDLVQRRSWQVPPANQSPPADNVW